MTVTVLIIENPLEPKTVTRHEADDVAEFLKQHFGRWPQQARIYDIAENMAAAERGDYVAACTSCADVTPDSADAIDRLRAMPGPFLVAVAPADPVTAIIAVVAVVAAVVGTLLLMPSIPKVNEQVDSPNNSLANRQNQARPGSRIPDIYGTVVSTPDLLAVPYRVFTDNVESEISFMCVGRGHYAITEVRDGKTLLQNIAGSSALFYAPGTAPGDGSPFLQIGAPIAEPVLSVVKMNDVNGQVLKASNRNAVQGEDDIRFVYPDQIVSTGDIEWPDYFAVGETITITGAGFTAALPLVSVTESAKFTEAGEIVFDTYNPTADFTVGDIVAVSNAGFIGDTGADPVFLDLSGSYEVTAVDSTSLTLDAPEAVNPDWLLVADLTANETDVKTCIFSTGGGAASELDLAGDYEILSLTDTTLTLANPTLVNAAWEALQDLPDNTATLSPAISTSEDGWVGPFVIELDELNAVYANFIAQQGLYKVTQKKGRQTAASVSVELELTPVDDNDDPTGAPELFTATLTGSATEKEQVAVTLKALPTFTGRCQARARRTTPTDLEFDGTVVDEIKWRDGYGMADADLSMMGDVTTVHTKTTVTAAATSVKDRKLNCKATRKLPQRVSGDEFSETLYATDRVDDIIVALALDKNIGGRSIAEVDVDSVYDTVAEVEAYFGSEKAVEFGYTFGDDNLSFEETLFIVTSACFCVPYREGSKIKLAFERRNDASTLLFNHRNILPNTQQRSYRFGNVNDNDGVLLEYVDPKDGAQLTLSVPPLGSSFSPKSFDVPGVQSDELAYWHAWRRWNKMRFQREVVEFTATDEAVLVRPPDRVLVTDLTRAIGWEGEVVEQDGLELRLSQPAPPAGGDYTMFVQHIDLTVEAVTVTPRPDLGRYWIETDTALRLPLAVGADFAANARYEIVEAEDRRTRAYLIEQRRPQSNLTEAVRAVNYSPLYYINDHLLFWLPFGAYGTADNGPFSYGVAVIGGGLATDTARGKSVWLGTGSGTGLAVTGMTLPDSFTVAGWLKSPVGQIADFDGATLAVTTGQLILSDGTSSVSAAWPSDSEWHQFAATHYDGAVVLYIDGLPVTTGTAAPTGAPDPLLLTDYAGRVEDLRIWSRALTAAEAWAVYTSSIAPFA